MNWTTNDKPIEQVQPEREDTLRLTDSSNIRICYSRWQMVWLSVDLPINNRKLDHADRDGTRCMVLRELLPLAEAALMALRQAVAELPCQCADVASVTAATSAALVADYRGRETNG